MLTTPLIHPQLLAALGRTGHGARILIGDGNFAHSAGAPHAERVYLNLRPGVLDVDTILDALLTVVPVESAAVMATPDGSEPPAVAGFRRALGDAHIEALERFAFYEVARSDETVLVIASADVRPFANILLTVGVHLPG
jgi:L-fucose mutarotase